MLQRVFRLDLKPELPRCGAARDGAAHAARCLVVWLPVYVAFVIRLKAGLQVAADDHNLSTT